MAIIDSDIDFEHLESLLKQEEITLETFDLSQQSIEEESSDIFKIFLLTINSLDILPIILCSFTSKTSNQNLSPLCIIFT